MRFRVAAPPIVIVKAPPRDGFGKVLLLRCCLDVA
nr:MAG TPA: hypothetical protein [Caudoviricetes sp.]